jgi:HTH-type transcriptional regulator / antitoxin HigA
MEGRAVTNDRVPAEVFPPGEFLRDELEARGWNQTEFAEILGREPRVVNEIILAKRAITPETALELSAALGTSAQFWLNLESAYQLSKALPRDADRIAREAALRGRFPVREMMKRGWIKTTKETYEIEKSILSFFEINSVNDNIQFEHSARRHHAADLTQVQLAWLFRVRQLAKALQVPKYSEQKLRKAIVALEMLMTEPEEIRRVPQILAECGVRLVIVEPIPGSKIDGVCFWINGNESPVIGLSLKGDQIDKFWFNLWHEIEHVLRGDGKDELIVDDFDAPVSEVECEKASNTAAANHCVPIREMNDFVTRLNPMFSEKNLTGFSQLMKRHPGIVAGQLQKRVNRWDLFKKYQVKVRYIIVQTALTDGYGRSAPTDL